MPNADRRFAFTPRALDDLEAIWDHGADRWSPDQADRYQTDLFRLFALLAERPHMARERPVLGDGIRVHPYASHLIVYRVLDDGIQIVRVPHGRQDLRALLD